MKQTYSQHFYDSNRQGSLQSAKIVIPLIMSIIDDIDSVVDFGCGIGAWLSVFKENGVRHILGVDGDYVDTSTLEIDKSEFIPHNLTTRLDLNKRFSLAMSLEVAEHLPHDKAQMFVDMLCCHSDVILFAAAIPGQGGTYHINEAYPSYWAKLFKKNGYEINDCLRGHIWSNKEIEYWYRQNIFLFTKKRSFQNEHVLDIVHPEMFASKGKIVSLRGLISLQMWIFRNFPSYVMKSLHRRFKKTKNGGANS